MKTRRLPFNTHVSEYEDWFEKYPKVFETELNAIKSMLPLTHHLEGLEVGVATGRFAKALNIHHGVEPAESMRELALKRGIYAINASAENLPYKGLSFDYLLMNFCISYFDDVQAAFVEAWRVLRSGGFLIVAFLEKNSPVARSYERRTTTGIFYKQAKFYTVEEVTKMLGQAGFSTIEFNQAIFHQPEKINSVEKTLPGYGKGSYVLIKATKGKSLQDDKYVKP